MSHERVWITKLPEDLTLNEFHAVPTTEDQGLVVAIGKSCLDVWHQDTTVAPLFDLSIGRRILDEGRILCVEMPVLREVFSKAQGFKIDGAIHVGDADYILIPQYPTAYLKHLRNLANIPTQFSSYGLSVSSENNMGATHKEILLDQRFIIQLLLEGNLSEAKRLLEYLLTDKPRHALYRVSVSEEMAHAVIDPYIKIAKTQFGIPSASGFSKVLSEGLANGLSLRTLTVEDLTSLCLLTDWHFKMLSALFFQEMISNGLITEMKGPVWDSKLFDQITRLMKKIYGSYSFDPNVRREYRYPPSGYGEADWLTGLKQQ